MKNIIDIMDEVTKFIVGGDDESLLDKKKRTMGFVPEAVKPKRCLLYTSDAADE